MKGKVCEIFGWTFLEFDEQPADELMQYLRLRALEHEMAAVKAASRRHGTE